MELDGTLNIQNAKKILLDKLGYPEESFCNILTVEGNLLKNEMLIKEAKSASLIFEVVAKKVDSAIKRAVRNRRASLKLGKAALR
jgi:hypothetical protein